MKGGHLIRRASSPTASFASVQLSGNSSNGVRIYLNAGLPFLTHNKCFVLLTIKCDPCLAFQDDPWCLSACLTLDELQPQGFVTNDDLKKKNTTKQHHPLGLMLHFGTKFLSYDDKPLNCLSCIRARAAWRATLLCTHLFHTTVVPFLDQESLKVNCFLVGPARPLYWIVWPTLCCWPCGPSIPTPDLWCYFSKELVPGWNLFVRRKRRLHNRHKNWLFWNKRQKGLAPMRCHCGCVNGTFKEYNKILPSSLWMPQ